MVKGRMGKGNANSPNTGGAPPPPAPTNNKIPIPNGQQIAPQVNGYTPTAAAGSNTAATNAAVK